MGLLKVGDVGPDLRFSAYLKAAKVLQLAYIDTLSLIIRTKAFSPSQVIRI